MEAQLVNELPVGDGWQYEPKWDGYRALAYVRGGDAKLVSRRGNDLTERFALVAKELAKALRTPDAVVDGEVVALDSDGRATFSAMQQGSARLAYEVFDVLEIDGESTVDRPLTERRARLEKLLAPNPVVQLSGSFADGEALLEEKRDGGLTVCLHGERLEGTWALVPAHLSGDEKNWLILRKREEGAPPSGRRVYRPMLATLTKELPRGEGWLFEPKWDGYRVLAYVRGGEVKLVSRRGNDRRGSMSTSVRPSAESPPAELS